MGFSRQDLESKQRTIESKVDFVMEAIKIQAMEGFLNPVMVTKSLGQLWQEAVWAGKWPKQPEIELSEETIEVDDVPAQPTPTD